MLIRARDGTMMFRVYHDDESFTDYEIRHDDLSVMIDKDALAAFYKVCEERILDHSPQVLGLERIEDRGHALPCFECATNDETSLDTTE